MACVGLALFAPKMLRSHLPSSLIERARVGGAHANRRRLHRLDDYRA